MTPAVSFLILSLALGAPAAFGESKKWTHGRTSCDPGSQQIMDAGSAVSVKGEPLAKAWDYALSDLEPLGNLTCFPEAERAAAALAAEFRLIENQVVPGVRAAGCEAGARSPRRDIELVRESARRLRSSEVSFESAFDRYDAFLREINASVPAEGVSFDDCRAKAQRGWARARASLNRLSCEVAGSLERVESLRDQVESAGSWAMDCPAPSSEVAVSPNAQPIGGTAVMMVAPSAPTTELNPLPLPQ